jgi:hypothetical protein
MHDIWPKLWHGLQWVTQQLFPIGSFLTASAIGGYLFQYCQRHGFSFITRRLKLSEKREWVKTKAQVCTRRFRRQQAATVVVVDPALDALLRDAMKRERVECDNHQTRRERALELQKLVKS